MGTLRGHFHKGPKMAAADGSRFGAVIGCRSIQLGPEAVWSAPVD